MIPVSSAVACKPAGRLTAIKTGPTNTFARLCVVWTPKFNMVPVSAASEFVRTQAVPGGRSYSGLKAADRAWHALCHGSSAPPTQVITEVPRPVASGPENLDQYDVVVLGGTLGIFMATALLLRGYSVLVLERNQLRGRDQDWNISRADMKVWPWSFPL